MLKFFKIRKEVKEARKAINARGYGYVCKEICDVLCRHGYVATTEPNNNGLYLIRTN